MCVWCNIRTILRCKQLYSGTCVCGVKGQCCTVWSLSHVCVCGCSLRFLQVCLYTSGPLQIHFGAHCTVQSFRVHHVIHSLVVKGDPPLLADWLQSPLLPVCAQSYIMNLTVCLTVNMAGVLECVMDWIIPHLLSDKQPHTHMKSLCLQLGDEMLMLN